MPDGFPFIHSPASPLTSMLANLAAQGNAARLNAYGPLAQALAGIGQDVGRGITQRTAYEQGAERQKDEQAFRARERVSAADDAYAQAVALERLRQKGEMERAGLGEARRWAENVGGAISSTLGGLKDMAYKAGTLQIRREGVEQQRKQLEFDKTKEENAVRQRDRTHDLAVEMQRSIVEDRAAKSADRALHARLAKIRPRLDVIREEIKTFSKRQEDLEKKLMLTGVASPQDMARMRTELTGIDTRLGQLRGERDRLLGAIDIQPGTPVAGAATESVDEDLRGLSER